MAPEIILQNEIDSKIDIWSLGITAIELATGIPPYFHIHPMRVLFMITKNEPPTLDGNFSKLFKDFVKLCLQKDSFERPTAKELLKHPFIKRAKNTSHLLELIDRASRWKLVVCDSEDSDECGEVCRFRSDDNCDDWDFDGSEPNVIVNSTTTVSTPLQNDSRNSNNNSNENRSFEKVNDYTRRKQDSTIN